MPGVYAQGLCKDANPTKHTQPFMGKGVFGKDAEIRTHPALHEAKPSECPKGDRGSELEVCFKNILFLQTEAVHQGDARLQTVEKPLSLIKMGSQGRSPRQGLGAVAPVI